MAPEPPRCSKDYTNLKALFLTVILDSFGKASLKTLVHGLQPSGDVSLPELAGLGAHQLL